MIINVDFYSLGFPKKFLEKWLGSGTGTGTFGAAGGFILAILTSGSGQHID